MSRSLSVVPLFAFLLVAGCGQGDGPTPIPGTPAPPQPPVSCDTINFEDACGPFTFSDFAGGVAGIVRNPDAAGLNTTDKVARMQKFADEPFGGSTLEPPERINFAGGEAFKMKVWASRAVPVLFKFEGLNRERSANHSGSSNWEEVCFDFTGDTAGNAVTGITFIFDNGVQGAAGTDPDAWTFFFDEIEQVASCPTRPPLFPIDFERDPATYDFGAEAGFGGGVSTVIANPDQSGMNTSAQTARMQKFAGETFGGSTLALGETVNFSQGQAFRMKVWSSRAVPVLFKFEGPDSGSQDDDRERSLSHSGSSEWEDLCFDFTGDTAGVSSSAITFIFDNGVVGDAANDPDNWTFYFDDIRQVVSCSGSPPGGVFPVGFEGDPASYDFGPEAGFGGGVSTVIANPDQSGINTSAQTARMQKFAGEVFGGSTLALGGTVDFSQGQAFRMKVWSSRAVPVLFKFEGPDSGAQDDDRERSLTHSGSGEWEDLCFDFTGDTAGVTSSAITFIFDLGVAGNADNDPDNWTFYFDDIRQVASCAGTPPGGVFPVDFEADPPSYDFGPDAGFAGGVATVIANPDQSGINTSAQTARMQKFAGEGFGGATLALGSSVDFAEGQAFRMKVWASRAVPVLFKFEGLERERSVTHSGGGEWQDLCFDFSGDTTGPATSAITFIFDLGVVGDAQNDPDNWTFYFDDIRQVADCGIAPATFPVDFEADPASYNFGPEAGFAGGVATVIANPDQSGINTSAQTARMQKFAGEGFGGATLALGGNVNFAQGQAFRMKVWASRAVPVLFKFEGLNRERSVTHSGGGEWQDLCFDFTGDTAGPVTNSITFIFDLGVVGDAQNDPDNWTFYFDDIRQVADCGVPPATFPIDFEADPASYNFGPEAGFAGGVATVIANPDQSGINTSAQTARMQKFAGEVFGGATLALGGNVDFAQGQAFRMKVWASRAVPVLFKFEGLNRERSVTHSGSGSWEDLCFDFTGDTAGPVTSAITFIFDLGVAGDAANDPDNWTFYFDDIRQAADCSTGGGGGGGGATDVGFEGDASQFDFGPDGGFGGGVSTVIANPDPSGINTSGQVVQMQKFAGEVFGGSTLSLPEGVQWSQGDTFTMKVWSQRQVPVLFKLEGLNQERNASHDGGSVWQELCFDFTGATAGAAVTGITIIFDLGVAGDAANDPDNWTFYYDDIQQSDAGCAVAPGAFETITFDDPDTTYTLTDFGNNLSTITNDPAGGSNMVGQVVKPVTAELWAGTTVSTLPGDAVPAIPLDANETRMSVRVYSPDAGIPIRLKIEDASDPTVSVETEASTTQVNAWETLVFDFANEVSGTAPFNEANTYNRISIFFNFGTTGAAAGEKTYYFDDIAVGAADGGGGGGAGDELAVNGGFESGNLDGWTVFENGGSVLPDNTESNGGAWSVHVVAGQGQNPVLKQANLAIGTVAPGDTIVISFDMKGSTSAGGVIFPELFSERADGASNEILDTIVAPTADWTTYSYSATAGADVTNGITFQLGVVCGGVVGCSADVFIDNVSISIAP